MNVLKMYFMSYQDLSNDYFNYQIKYQNTTLIYNMYFLVVLYVLLMELNNVKCTTFKTRYV